MFRKDIKKTMGILAVFMVAICLMAACSGTKLKMKPIATTENPTEQINLLNNAITLARKNQVNVLAPTWFARAESSLTSAKKALERGEELAEIFDSISRGRAELKEAEKFADVANATLPEVIKGRDLARAAGATNLGKDYADAEAEFLELTQAIEKNDLSFARRNQATVNQRFRQLELRAIKIHTIGEVRRLINQADRQGARKIAPRSFEVAEKKLKQADAFITQNPYKKEKMQQLAMEALFYARRLHEIAKQSKELQAMQPEQIALRQEAILHKVTAKLSATDMRDETLNTQVDNILGSIAALQDDRQFMLDKGKTQQAEIKGLKNQIASLEGQTRKEQAAKERLAEEKRFNQLFNEVRSYFESQEAEVYKQGNQLVIRLKAIQFPVGKYLIMPNNYTLLSKVQRAIRSFDKANVVIEGHTDSTGSDEVNEHLSQQRAESVREYFVANKTLPSREIVAVGYGSKQPLASNETEEGRAVNRRIDVVIRPLP